MGREVTVKVAALARCTPADVERAAKALEGEAGAPRIHIFIATSEIHLKYKLKKTQDQVLEEAVQRGRAGAQVRRRRRVLRRGRRAHRAPSISRRSRGRSSPPGARTVNIPDTVGYSIPEEYGALIGRVARALGSSGIVSVHCHDDLGLAVANSLAAVQAARARSSARSTASASAPATARWRRS